MTLLIYTGAIVFAALLSRGVLDGLSPASLRRWLFRAGAWTGVIGGGTYGLGCFDSGLLPGFSWLSLAVIVLGALAIVSGWIVLSWRRNRES